MTFEEIGQAIASIEQRKLYLGNLEQSILFYRDRLTAPKIANYTRRGGKSAHSNQFEQAMTELLELDLLYERELSSVLSSERKIYKAISVLDIEQQNIIIDKYIHGKTWKEVAEKFSYDERTVYRRRKKALEKLSKIENFLDDL